MLGLFTVAIAVAAALLFVVQPMVGKMILPLGGGSPQVWITALVFFQAALLAGYAYAHYSVRWLGPKRQIQLHALVLLLPALALPIALPDIAAPEGTGQSLWILTLLTLGVGAPFFVLAAASPLLQTWLASTDHEDARDPYFLYAGSNAGSLVGLLIYPFLVEPLLPLSVQARWWALGYAAFVVLALGCGVVAVRSMRRAETVHAAVPDTPVGAPPRPAPLVASAAAPGAPVLPGGSSLDTAADREGAPPAAAASAGAAAQPSRSDRTFWLFAAAVPSALLMGVTHYLTSSIAPLPLLWVLPLAVYLVTFIVAFARRRTVSVERTSRVLAIFAVLAALTLLARIGDPIWLVTTLHLGVLGTAALLCHLRLAERRPATSHLTEFYLLISLGGVLGGAFSALVAPVMFDHIAEYPIALVLAALLRIPMGGSSAGEAGGAEHAGDPAEVDGSGHAAPDAAGRTGGGRWISGLRIRPADLALPGLLGAFLLVGERVLTSVESIPDGVVVLALAVLPSILVFLFSPRPLRFALGLALLFGFAQSGHMYRGEILLQERTFFGIYRVARDPAEGYNILYHGTTAHGVQSLDAEEADEPLAYYHRSGPAGGIVAAMAERPDKQDIALVGAGTGALAVLAGPHQHVTLYEIDPKVVEIAEDPRYFSFLDRSRASYETVVGDGRIELRERVDDRYDLIVLDAFTSGSIPIHLMTREAVQLYLDRLRPRGAMLFHISNRHLELAPVLGAHARDLGLVGYENVDGRTRTEEGILGSHWVILVRSPEDLAGIPDTGWRALEVPPDAPAWTDDFSNLLTVQRWF